MILNKKIVFVGIIVIILIVIMVVVFNNNKTRNLKNDNVTNKGNDNTIIHQMYQDDSLHTNEMDIEPDKDFDQNGKLKYPTMNYQQ